MIEIFDRSKHIPVPSGLVSTLRSLEIGESISVPAAKKHSIHPAAKKAGIRMTIRTLGDGMVRAWRVPLKGDSTPAPTTAPQPPAPSTAAVVIKPASIFDDPTAADTVPEPTASADPPKPTRSGKGYFQPYRFGPRIYTEDLSTVPADSIFE